MTSRAFNTYSYRARVCSTEKDARTGLQRRRGFLLANGRTALES